MKNHLEAMRHNEMSTGFRSRLNSGTSPDDVARACIYFRFMQKSAHYLGAKRGEARMLPLNHAVSK